MNPQTLSEKLLFATVRLEVQKAAGVALGSGFFFCIETSEGTSIPFLVTNKHVVEGGIKLRTHVHLCNDGGQPIVGTSWPLELSAPQKEFFPHPNPHVDLCVHPVGPLLNNAAKLGHPLYAPSLGSSLVRNDSGLEDLNALEDVIMVGYPNGLWDSANNLPLMRRGITASHPAVKFNHKPWGVVDVACFHGSSGSPILILNEGSHLPKGGGLNLSSRVILLGVLFGGPTRETDGRIEIRPIPTIAEPVPVTTQMLHLGYYVRASALKEFCESLVREIGHQPKT